jgi:hypothetical protein
VIPCTSSRPQLPLYTNPYPGTGQGSWSSTNLGLPRGLDAPAGGLGRFLTHLDLHDDVSAATKSKEAAEQLEGKGVGVWCAVIQCATGI